MLEQKIQLMGCDGCGERFCLMGLTHSSMSSKKRKKSYSLIPAAISAAWQPTLLAYVIFLMCLATLASAYQPMSLLPEKITDQFFQQNNLSHVYEISTDPELNFCTTSFFCLAESQQFVSFSAFQDSFVEQLRRWTRSFIASFALILVQIPDTRYPQIPTLGPTIP